MNVSPIIIAAIAANMKYELEGLIIKMETYHLKRQPMAPMQNNDAPV